MPFVTMKKPLVHILETAKIKYLISLQFRYTKQTKTFFFFCKFWSRDCHSTANSYQNVKFYDLAEISKFKMAAFLHRIFVKSHFKIGTMKILKMTSSILSSLFIIKQMFGWPDLPLLHCLLHILCTLIKTITWCVQI